VSPRPIVASAGAINWDVNLFVKMIPKAGEETPVNRITRLPGGKAANVAVAMARLLGENRSALIGALGNDPIKDEHLKMFKKEGVVTSGITLVPSEESGQAYIIIDEDGQNVISTHFGANAMLNPALLKDKGVREILRSIKMLVVMDAPLEFARALLSKSAGIGNINLWSPGVRTLGGLKAMKKMLSLTNFLVLNEPELLNLTDAHSTEEGYRSLKKENDSLNLIVTHGKDGAMLITPDSKIKESGIDLGSIGKKAVNTVGCGDAFIGCFAAQLVNGSTPAKALKMANFAGSFKATRFETRGSPTSSELSSFVKLFSRL